MGRDADIVVVGAGITGVATARALAQAGRGVVLIDQFEPGHTRGLEPRRLADLPPLLPRPALRPARPGRAAELARARGGVRRAADRARRAVSTSGPSRLENARALAVVRRPARAPHRAQVAERWPIAAEPSEPVLYQPDGGTTLADRAYRAMLGGRGRRRSGRSSTICASRRSSPTGARSGSVTDGGRVHGTRMRRRRGRLGPGAARRAPRSSYRSIPTTRDGRLLPAPRSRSPSRRSSTTPCPTPRSTACSGRA